MKSVRGLAALLILLTLGSSVPSLAQTDTLRVTHEGLNEPIEIIKDE